MIRTIDTDLLMGCEQIANEAGVISAAVSNWQMRYSDFPTPVYSNGKRVKVWYWPEVATWLYKHDKFETDVQIHATAHMHQYGHDFDNSDHCSNCNAEQYEGDAYYGGCSRMVVYVDSRRKAKPTQDNIDFTIDLCGISDIASLVGVTQPCVSNWTVRHADFPVSWNGTLNGKRVKVWYWSEVSSWLYQNGKI